MLFIKKLLMLEHLVPVETFKLMLTAMMLPNALIVANACDAATPQRE